MARTASLYRQIIDTNSGRLHGVPAHDSGSHCCSSMGKSGPASDTPSNRSARPCTGQGRNASSSSPAVTHIAAGDFSGNDDESGVTPCMHKPLPFFALVQIMVNLPARLCRIWTIGRGILEQGR